MMGHQDPLQSKLFYTDLNIDKRIRTDHPLRLPVRLHADRQDRQIHRLQFRFQRGERQIRPQWKCLCSAPFNTQSNAPSRILQRSLRKRTDGYTT